MRWTAAPELKDPPTGADGERMVAMSWNVARQRLPPALQLLLFASCTYLVGLLSVEVFRPPGSTLAVWWPVAGMGLVATLIARAPERRWVVGAHLVTSAAINVTGGQELRVAVSALLLFGLLPMRQLPSRAEAGRVEVAGQWLLVTAVVLTVFAPTQRLPLVFLVVPALLWASLRSDVRVLAGQLVSTAGIAAAMTLRGGGPFAATGAAGATQTVADSVALVQLFAATVALVMLTTFLIVQGRREAAATVARRDRRLQLIHDQGLTGVVELQLAPDGLRLVSANRIAVGLLGGTNRRRATTRWCDLFVDDDRRTLRRGVEALIAGQLDSWHGELQSDGDAGPRWFEVALFLEPDPDGPQQFVAQMLDVTERRSIERHLQALALREPLTGLANRTLFFDRLDHALAAAPRTGRHAGLLVLDLDGFEPVNDRFGHRAGDTILVELARRLERHVRPGDTVARLGGDEFAVVLDQVDDPADVDATAHRLRTELRRPVLLEGGDRVDVGASIGWVTSVGADDAHELLHRADLSMYAAEQRAGGAQVPAGAGG